MNTTRAPQTTTAHRLVAFAFAVVATVVTIGGTAGAMQLAAERDSHQVQSLAAVTINGSKVP